MTLLSGSLLNDNNIVIIINDDNDPLYTLGGRVVAAGTDLCDVPVLYIALVYSEMTIQSSVISS